MDGLALLLLLDLLGQGGGSVVDDGLHCLGAGECGCGWRQGWRDAGDGICLEIMMQKGMSDVQRIRRDGV